MNCSRKGALSVVGWRSELALDQIGQSMVSKTHGECGLLNGRRGDGLDGGGDRAGGLLGGILNVVENVLCGRDSGVAAEGEDGGGTHVEGGSENRLELLVCVRECCWGEGNNKCGVNTKVVEDRWTAGLIPGAFNGRGGNRTAGVDVRANIRPLNLRRGDGSSGVQVLLSGCNLDLSIIFTLVPPCITRYNHVKSIACLGM